MRESRIEVSILIGFIIVAITIGIFFGYLTEERLMRQEAVENGVAEWICDSKTGKTEFKWKTPVEKNTQVGEAGTTKGKAGK
jgi:hypothetical protein